MSAERSPNGHTENPVRIPRRHRPAEDQRRGQNRVGGLGEGDGATADRGHFPRAAGCSYARSSPLAPMLSPPVAEISHRGRAVVSEVEPAVRVSGLQDAPHAVPGVGVPFSTFPSAN